VNQYGCIKDIETNNQTRGVRPQHETKQNLRKKRSYKGQSRSVNWETVKGTQELREVLGKIEKEDLLNVAA
jgi:hypothetical protein